MAEIALLAASTAIGAIGAIQEGKAAKQAANYNAQVAAQNATIATQGAAADEAALRRDNARYMATVRANIGASGTTSEGNPLDIIEDSAGIAELDALNIRYQGALKARGYNIEGEQQRALGRNSYQSGLFKATGIILGGGAKASPYVSGLSLGSGTSVYGSPGRNNGRAVTSPDGRVVGGI